MRRSGETLATSGEALATSVVGGALAAAVGSLAGLAVPAAIVGGLNGLVSGGRGIYDWRSVKGLGAFVLDSTWALPSTTAALACHAVATVQRDAGFSPPLSRRRNRHVYTKGLRPRRGFATTLGNVVNGAGDLAVPRRVKLVDDHEDVHVWQARWFGPAFPVLYVGWMIGGGGVAVVGWLVSGRRRPFGKTVETYAYYLNPFEWWAYSRDDHWPPSRKLPGVGWSKPAVRSFARSRGD